MLKTTDKNCIAIDEKFIDVSPIVNSAKYDGPECIHPVSDDEIPSGRQLSLL